jgi:hypothetical protein
MRYAWIAASFLFAFFCINLSESPSGAPIIGLSGPSSARAQAICPAGQVPDENKNCCAPSALRAAPDGGSICPGGFLIPKDASSKNRFLLPPLVISPGRFANLDDAISAIVDWEDFSANRSTYGRLGMYVTPDTGVGNSFMLGAGGYGARTSGVGVTDTAGLIAPGSVSTASRTSGGSGGVSGSYDASNFVGSNQKFILNGAFNYTSSRTNFSAASGSINSDTYGFRGSALYSNYATYLVLSGSYEFGNNNEFFAADASSGSYRSDGYNVDARLGHVFVLFNSISASAPSRMPVKAAPRAADGGYGIGLDLSGHLGYSSGVARGFTDTSGFTFGDNRVRGGETGLRAKLFAAVPRNGIIWQPYISGSVDWRFDYSHIASFPTQVALAGGDAVNFTDGTTFVGAQVGLDVRAANGWTVGVNGFYSHSSDTDIAGGRAYVRIPFGPAAVAARY